MSARLVALLIVLAAHPASSQHSAPLGRHVSVGRLVSAGTPTPRQEEQLLFRQSMGLLEEALSDRQLLKLAENRVRLAATAAGALWSMDPDRSRALFQEARQELVGLIERIDPEKEYHSEVGAPQQLRHEIVNMISPLDPVLALDFVRATRLPPRPRHGPFDRPSDEEAGLELNLAMQIAQRDPAVAFRAACEQLERGLHSSIANVLSALQQQNPGLAADLAALIFQKLRPGNLANDPEAANLLSSLLYASGGFEETPASLGSAGRDRQKQLRSFNERVFRQCLDAAGAFLTGKSVDTMALNLNESMSYKSLLAALNSLLPKVQKIAPSLAADIQRKAKEMKASADSYERVQAEYAEILSKGSADEILAAASQLPDEWKDGFYQSAIWNGSMNQEPERLRQAISQHVSNPETRRSLLERLDQQAAQREAANGRIAEAVQRISRLKSQDARASALIDLFHRVPEEQKEKMSWLLSQALGELGGQPESPQSLHTLLSLVGVMGRHRFSAAQGFDLLETLIGQLNSIVDATAVLDGLLWYGPRQFKEGEFVCQPSGQLGSYMSQAVATVAGFASQDFERTQQLASRFQRPEIRAWARLALAQAGLAAMTAPPPARKR